MDLALLDGLRSCLRDAVYISRDARDHFIQISFGYGLNLDQAQSSPSP